MFLECTQITGGPAEQVFCSICRFCPGLGWSSSVLRSTALILMCSHLGYYKQLEAPEFQNTSSEKTSINNELSRDNDLGRGAGIKAKESLKNTCFNPWLVGWAEVRWWFQGMLKRIILTYERRMRKGESGLIAGSISTGWKSGCAVVRRWWQSLSMKHLRLDKGNDPCNDIRDENIYQSHFMFCCFAWFFYVGGITLFSLLVLLPPFVLSMVDLNSISRRSGLLKVQNTCIFN